MAALSPFLRSMEGGLIAFWCPGCKCAHAIRVDAPDQPCWGWDRNVTAPTFSPSILVLGTEPLTEAEYQQEMSGVNIRKPETICHSFVRAGQIEFLPDSTHALSGCAVPMSTWPMGC